MPEQVIGVRPATNEVIVRDTKTDTITVRAGDPAQVQQVKSDLDTGRIGEFSRNYPTYEPPAGYTYEQAIKETYPAPEGKDTLPPELIEHARRAGRLTGEAIHEAFDPAPKVVASIRAAEKVAKTIKSDAEPYIRGLIDPYTEIPKAKTYSDLPSYKVAKATDEAYRTKEQQELLVKGEQTLPVTEKAKMIGLHTADIIVPGVWTRHWNEMSDTDRKINIGLDVICLLPIVGWGAKVGIKTALKATFRASVKNTFNTAASKKFEKEFGKALVKLETGLQRADAGFIKEAGRDMKKLSKNMRERGATDNGSKALLERGKFFEQNANDIKNSIDIVKERPLSPNEKKLLKADLEGAKGYLAKYGEATDIVLPKEALERELVTIVEPEPPKFTIGEGRVITSPGKLGLNISGKIGGGAKAGAQTVIPIEAFGRMTRSQLAKEYETSEEAITDAVSKVPLTVKEAINTQEKAREQGKPKPEPKPTPKPKPKADAEPSPKPKAASELKAAPSEAPKPSPKPKPEPKPQPKTLPKPKTEAKPKVVPRTLREKYKPKPKPRIPLPKGATNAEKRAYIAEADGALCWRQGEVGGKDIWHVIMYPYQSKDDYVAVIGGKPNGATRVTGPGSAYETVTLTRGKPPANKVTGDFGIMDFFIEPRGGKKVGIGFKADPKQQTTGDITIGHHSPQLTHRKPALTSKRPRISR